jgi:hypothetical protein
MKNYIGKEAETMASLVKKMDYLTIRKKYKEPRSKIQGMKTKKEK